MDIHDRFGALQTLAATNLDFTGDDMAARALFRSWPDGLLQIVEAGDVDWSQS